MSTTIRAGRPAGTHGGGPVTPSLVTLQRDADVSTVERSLQGLGLWTSRHIDEGGAVRAITVKPCSAWVPSERILGLAGVAEVLGAPSSHPRIDALAGSGVAVDQATIGGGAPTVLVAGPCSVESAQQVDEAAEMAARAGARILRGGAFKPRTSPYSFSGHGDDALRWMRDAADRHGLAMVTEVMSEHDTPKVAEVADLLQVGSRNMQNFALLRALGATGKPVLLKRGEVASLETWLLAAEHLLVAGAAGVIFCERGVKGFDGSTRNLFDLGVVALLRHVYRLPVMADPSHAVGRRDLIPVLAGAAVAAGADAVMVEVHPDPGASRSDGPQALDAAGLEAVAEHIR